MIQEKQRIDPDKNLQVVSINDAYRMKGFRQKEVINSGKNPENGVVMNYYLKNVSDSSQVFISFFDKKKKLIKSFSTVAKDSTEKIEVEQGMNRFVWDMEYAPPAKVDGMILWNQPSGGPKVAPGNYIARITHESDSLEIPFTVKADPNYKMTEEAYDQQVEFLLTVRDKFSDIQNAIKDIRSIRGQINTLTSRMDTIANKEIKIYVDSINSRLTRVEESMYQTKAKSGQDVLNYPIRLNDKMAGLFEYANSGFNPPSAQVTELFTLLSNEADVYLNQLKSIMQVDVTRLNEMIHNQKVPVIGVKK